MAAGRWWGAVGEGPTVPVRARAEPGVEVPHGSGDVPIFHIKQTYPVARHLPSHRGDQTQATGGDAVRMQPLPPPRCASLRPNRRMTAHPSTQTQAKTPIASRQAGLALSAEFRRSCSDPRASY